MISLSKQIYMYSLSTDAFYNEGEMEIHNKLNKTYHFKYRVSDKSEKNKERNYDKYIKYANKRIKHFKNLLYEEFDKNKAGRNLNVNSLTDKRVISVFDSVLSRVLNVKQNDLTKDVIVVQTFFFQVLEDLIKNGFNYMGDRFVCFTASAGQIRTKKTMFIRESVWLKHQNTLTCGLTIDDINKKGGINSNKLLAYLALCNSATDEWKRFNIQKSIVVEDLETLVNGEVDYIDSENFNVERKTMDIPIPHTDGCGMILPQRSKKSFMVRMPWLKGLLVPTPFDKFCEKYNKSLVVDIYGKEWDLLKDEIEVVFTKSQFKTWSYYSSWEDYKEKFTKYNCKAAKCNEEEDEFQNARLNYQMLQSLSDMTLSELEEVAKETSNDILNISTDKDTMLRVLGATKSRKNKNYLQKSLEIYPALLNDFYSKDIIKNKKKSMVKEAKSGKLRINGTYTFIIPDMFAFCERLILGIDNPQGLLGNGEVYCNLYKDYEKLDCLRSPHLHLEHAVRKNVVDEDKSEWFITNGLYTSVHDLISKELQFDCDGDKSLVCADKTMINVAERNMKDVKPLYYEMASAKKEIITNQSIYDGLQAAYKGNIGIISNDISKIWNSENINIEAVKWLTSYNNFVIDYAKTLYLPKIPSDKKKIINSFTRSKVPYFFIHAKNKLKNNVEPINESTVNKLNYIIPENRINFKKVAGEFNYKHLMRNRKMKLDQAIIDKYIELDRTKRFKINRSEPLTSNEILYAYKKIREELLEINNDAEYVADVLIKHLYENKSSRKKTLWESFGDVIFNNLQMNLKNTKPCGCCGKLIDAVNNRTKYCEKCWKKKQKQWQRESMKKSRKTLKM